MNVSVIVIAKNEIEMIANCLDSVAWADEIVVIDHASTDTTAELARKQGAVVKKAPESSSFAELRELGRSVAKSDWLLYIDADEGVTPRLMVEIRKITSNESALDAYSIKRNNIHYGKWLQHGGWNNDKVVRLFKASALLGWKGTIHEHAEVEGEVGSIEEPLAHLTHRNLWDGIKKSEQWTKHEAQLFLEANHPSISSLRLIKIVMQDFFIRFFIKKAWKDGTEGTIEAIVQTINRFFVYQQLWEMQRKPSLEKTYQAIEREIMDQWQKHRE